MTDHNHQFWSRLDDINSGMLGVTQDSRLVPMSHYTDRKVGVLWFITAKDTDLARSVASGPQDAMHVVSDAGQGLYARIHGTLSLSDNRAKLDELWNAVASSWFEDGKQDPDVQLLRLDLTEAEVWATGGSMAFLYQIAKSKITGDKPDMGDHYSLTF
ncbi:general stress protein [Paracoccus sp. S4493]|uniref:pyridoxamine 5'-phosphate oxidase family protein n=1 Tax=Paracoccus TaxID=265 RepID=UPI0005F9E878|nr:MULTISPECIES: pyridoxamine 5'-phosphate oxidase family protein [Paracoccus]AZY93616.1 general stress protein [Paracoccus sp. Arc7-R13]KJZ32661.1 general stress protein [Paracoccus sp. S4493]TNC06778.1 general stress protein [Paracoccus marcusii]